MSPQALPECAQVLRAAPTSYVLDIEWPANIRLPNLVGPFHTDIEATRWADVHIADWPAEWKLDRLTSPHLHRPQRCTTRYHGSMPGLARDPDCCLQLGHVGDHVAATGYRWPNETPRRQL